MLMWPILGVSTRECVYFMQMSMMHIDIPVQCKTSKQPTQLRGNQHSLLGVTLFNQLEMVQSAAPARYHHHLSHILHRKNSIQTVNSFIQQQFFKDHCFFDEREPFFASSKFPISIKHYRISICISIFKNSVCDMRFFVRIDVFLCRIHSAFLPPQVILPLAKKFPINSMLNRERIKVLQHFSQFNYCYFRWMDTLSFSVDI